MSIYSKLMKVQSELKVPKNQRNSFGRFNYRSCEDILESLKPVLNKHELTLIIKDEIINIQDRFYIKAIVELIDTETGEKVEATALARESDMKKGMDLAQVTGSTSSYARKYALNGLFCIDDTKDSDATGTGETEVQRVITDKQVNDLYELAATVDISKEDTIKTIKTKYKVIPENMSTEQYEAVTATLNNLKGDAK